MGKMTKAAAIRIQKTQAPKTGGQPSKNSFESRTQSAGDRNSNTTEGNPKK